MARVLRHSRRALAFSTGEHGTDKRRIQSRDRNVTRPLILIADDNPDTREMYALYLGMVGYKVEEAADGREASIKARTFRPDLIVMDLQMPKVDGWAAIRELQSHDATAAIPVIILTGHDFKAFLKPAAVAAGAVSYLMKPCFPEQLAREISTWLTAHRTRRVAGIRR